MAVTEAERGTLGGVTAGAGVGSEPAVPARTEQNAEFKDKREGGAVSPVREDSRGEAEASRKEDTKGKAETSRKEVAKGRAETRKKPKAKRRAELKAKARKRAGRTPKGTVKPKGAARTKSSRSEGAKVPGRAGRGASGRRQELNQRVLAELRNLRLQLDQLVERFELRMGGQLNELIARIEGDPSLAQEPRLLTVRTAEAMLDAVSAGEIRPKKARPKDFARLEDVVRELGDLAPDE